jgi:RNA polymerase sigma-70 factor (ECF subfamily)
MNSHTFAVRTAYPTRPIAHRCHPAASADASDMLVSRDRHRVFDRAYLSALRDHDRQVENHLVEFFTRPICLKLYFRLRSPQLIEDARQETFLRVLTYFRSGKTLDNPASLPGFVHSVCNNVCCEMLRSHTRHQQIPEDEPELPDYASLNPEESLVTEERKQLVAGILGALAFKDRQLLRRVFLDEADKDTVCVEFGVSREYLRVLLHRAKLKLKAALSGDMREKWITPKP